VVRPGSGLGGIKSQYPAKEQPAVVSGGPKDVVRPTGGLPKPGANEPAKDAKKWEGMTIDPKKSKELTNNAAAAKSEEKASYAAKPAAAEAAKPAAAAAAAAKPAAAGGAGGTINRKDPHKIFVEKFEGKNHKEPVVLEQGEGEEAVRTGIFIGQCKGPDLVVQIKGKCKNITISGCENIAVVFDTCVTTCELISCKRIQVQAMTACGSYVVDKCDRTDLYVADASLEDQVVVYTCQSTASVVHQSTSNGEDQVEHAIPNQILSTFSANSAPTHKEVTPESE